MAASPPTIAIGDAPREAPVRRCAAHPPRLSLALVTDAGHDAPVRFHHWDSNGDVRAIHPYLAPIPPGAPPRAARQHVGLGLPPTIPFIGIYDEATCLAFFHRTTARSCTASGERARSSRSPSRASSATASCSSAAATSRTRSRPTASGTCRAIRIHRSVTSAWAGVGAVDADCDACRASSTGACLAPTSRRACLRLGR